MSGFSYPWKVGQRARVKYIRTQRSEHWKPGVVVTIERIYTPDEARELDGDCLVKMPAGFYARPLFEQLEPLEDLGSWDDLEATTGWKPGKTIQREKQKECEKC